MWFSRFIERRSILLCALFALVLCSSIAFAQFESASVLGYVRDASGATLPHAAVTLTNVQTGIAQTETTDDSGRFEFSSVLIGRYRVSSDATGFARTETEPFQLTVNARQRVDVDLKTGSVSEAVTVSSAPTLLETETSSRGGVTAAAQIENLPLNGRSYADRSAAARGSPVVARKPDDLKQGGLIQH